MFTIYLPNGVRFGKVSNKVTAVRLATKFGGWVCEPDRCLCGL